VTPRAAPLLALLLVACSTSTLDAVRTLPPDRDAAVVYVALGDSTVEGVGASSPALNYVSLLHVRLRAVYPGARVVNLGVGGATSADVLLRQLDRTIERRPQLVTLSIGPNDITTRVSVDVYEKNLETILARLRHETTAVVVVNSIPDLAVTPRFSRSRARETVGRLTVVFNEALKRRVTAHGAELVDLYATSRREVPLRPELIGRDGYHPSDAGYARWAELMWSGIQSRVATRNVSR